MPAGTLTASGLLALIKSVDGSGSGLDADLLRATTPTAASLTFLLLNATTGNVIYASGTNTWAAAAPDTAGLVDKASTQTGIGGNKSFTGNLDTTGSITAGLQSNFTQAGATAMRGIRTSASTNAASIAGAVRHTTTADMIDGFGSSMSWEIVDSAAVTNVVGEVAFVRANGSDSTADFVIKPATAGSRTEKFRVTYDGHATLSATFSAGTYTVATLPTAGTARRLAYASNGRKPGEGAAAGTGIYVYDDSVAWRSVADGTTIAA